MQEYSNPIGICMCRQCIGAAFIEISLIFCQTDKTVAGGHHIDAGAADIRFYFAKRIVDALQGIQFGIGAKVNGLDIVAVTGKYFKINIILKID